MKVTLGSIEEVDADLMFAWRNDRVVTKYLARQNMTRFDVEQWFAMLDENRRTYSIRAAGKAVGYATLDIDFVNRKCETGVIIGEKDYWGKGIGVKAARLIVVIAFDQLGLHRILAVSSELNTASIKCFKSAGFRIEGHLRDGYFRDGQFLDLILLSLLEDEWKCINHNHQHNLDLGM